MIGIGRRAPWFACLSAEHSRSVPPSKPAVESPHPLHGHLFSSDFFQKRRCILHFLHPRKEVPKETIDSIVALHNEAVQLEAYTVVIGTRDLIEAFSSFSQIPAIVERLGEISERLFGIDWITMPVQRVSVAVDEHGLIADVLPFTFGSPEGPHKKLVLFLQRSPRSIEPPG